MELALPLCEVLSRYSVPTFFFISGYGLFYSHPLEKPLEYRSFIKKRFKSIGIPYVVTSLFYMGVASLMARNLAMWHPKYVLFTLFFGLGNYHIYFSSSSCGSICSFPYGEAS